MKQLKIKCSQCGWETNVADNELEENAKCILCEGQMKIGDVSQLFDMLRPELINSMKKDIEGLSEKKVWNIIEGFSNPKARLNYRKLFFEAGGKIK